MISRASTRPKCLSSSEQSANLARKFALESTKFLPWNKRREEFTAFRNWTFFRTTKSHICPVIPTRLCTCSTTVMETDMSWPCSTVKLSKLMLSLLTQLLRKWTKILTYLCSKSNFGTQSSNSSRKSRTKAGRSSISGPLMTSPWASSNSRSFSQSTRPRLRLPP